ncbi:hypothetical protein [uncultured Tateyamaria sp.]|uniref:hypothetical protein n=1 Tax=Tateyamaria sp. 1078 TaxID=3417464 RepID=UPI0026302D90|nr:hypothetical protein [uncultured Tateyamaria sp.]
MTIQQQWPLQQAVWQRLTDALMGQGIGGADVPVFDHVPREPERLHVRIDGFLVVPHATKAGRRGRHEFSVHVFDDSTGDVTGRGGENVARLQPIVVAALEDWFPLPGATGIEHISSNSAADDDPLNQHRISRFSTHIGD